MSFNGSDFAFAPAAANTTLRAPLYTGGAEGVTAGAALTAAAHNQVSAGTTSGALTVSSLKINGSQTVNQTGLLTIQSAANTAGGILQTGGAGQITGAGITSGGTGDLVVRVNGPLDTLTLSATAPITSTTTGGLTKNGQGTLIIQGTNAQTGTTTINQGTIQLSGTGTLSGANRPLVIRQEGILDVNGLSTGTSVGALTGAGTITNGTGATAGTIVVGNGIVAATNSVFSGTIVDGATQPTNVTVTSAPTGVLVVNQALTGLSSYTGVTTIANTGAATAFSVLQANTLANIGSNSSIGRGDASSNTTNAASLVFAGGVLSYTGSTAQIYQTTQTPSIAIDRLFTLAAGGGIIQSNGQFGNNVLGAGTANNAALIFNNTGGAIAFSGAVGARTLTLGGNSTADNEMGIQLIESGGYALGITKDNASLWVLSNPANAYSGATTLVAGQLRANYNGLVTLPTTSNLAFNAATGTNGGVLESSGNFTRGLGTTGNTVQWSGTNGGGFAASEAKLNVNIGGALGTLTWGTTAQFINTNSAAAGLILNSTTALSEVEWQNPINLGTTTYTSPRLISVNDNTTTNTDFATISGNILAGTPGTNVTALAKNGAGTLYLTGANTFAGNGSGGALDIQAGNVVVNSMALGGPLGSGLAGTTGKVMLTSLTGTGGSLIYSGPGETVTRLINLAGAQSAASTVRLENDGSGPLKITALTNSATGAFTRTLELRGTNTDFNEVSAALANGSSTLQISKQDSGYWALTGNNGHTGGTTVGGGVLGIGNDNAVGTGTLLVSNGALQAINGSRGLSVGLVVNNNTTATLLGTNSFSFTATTALTSTGANNYTLANYLPAGQSAIFTGIITHGDTTANRAASFTGTGVTSLNGVIQNQGARTMGISNNMGASVQFGPGTLNIDGAGFPNTYTGTTALTSGILSLNKIGSEFPLGGSGGTPGPLAFNGNGFLQSTVAMTGADKLNTGTITLGNGNTGVTATFIGGQPIEFGAALFRQSDSASSVINVSNTGGVTFSGANFNLTQAAGALNFTVTGNNDTTINGIIGEFAGAAGSIIKNGSGILAVGSTGSVNTFTGNITVNAGAINATSNTVASNQLGAGALTLGGGALNFIKSDGTTAVQTYTGTTLTAATTSTLGVNASAGTMTVNTGSITRTAGTGGTILFNKATGTSVINVSTTTLGNWAVLNNAGNYTVAAKDGSNNLISAATTLEDNPALWVATQHVSDSAGFSGTFTSAGAAGANSVRFNTAAASALTIGAGSVLNVTGGTGLPGAILVTPNVGASAASITGGVLTSSSAELIIDQYNTGADFTINSRIENSFNGAGTPTALALTKTGAGTLLLNNNNNIYSGITYITEGTIKLAGGNAIGDRSAVTIANKVGATLDLNGSNETIGTLSGGGYLGGGTPAPGGMVGNSGAATVGGIVAIGGNTLTVNMAASGTYAGAITGSGGLVVQGVLPLSNANALTLASSTNAYTGTLSINNAQVIVNNGTGLAVSNAVGNLTNVGAITIRNGGGLSIDNAGSLTANRINDASPITLQNTPPSATVATVGLSTNTDQAAVTEQSLRNEIVGAVTLGGGNNTLRSVTATANANPVLTLADLTRTNCATLTVLGTNMATPLATTRGDVVVLNGANVTGLNLIGGGATINGSSNISILPWANGQSVGASIAAGPLGNTFVTYSTFGGFGNGFRALDLTTEYEQLLSAGGVTALNNARYSGNADFTFTGAAHTVNSLLVDNTSTTGLIQFKGAGAGDSINVGSGAFLFTGTQPIEVNSFGAGITAGTNEYIFHQNNTSAGGVTISSNLTSAAGITKSGPGFLKLTGTNSNLVAPIYVNQGTLAISSLAAINSLPVTLTGGNLGLVLDGDGTVRNETLVGPAFAINMTPGVDSGITVDRLGNGSANGPLLYQTAANKTIQSAGTISGLTNQVLTITNNSGYGLDMTGGFALSGVSAPTINVVTASASNQVQGLTLSGVVSGGVAGGVALTKVGAGALALTNAGNTFGSGGTIIDVQNGVLAASSAGALGDSGNIISLNPGPGLSATFRASSSMTLGAGTPTLRLGNLSTTNNRVIEVAEGATLTLNSVIDSSLAPGAPVQKGDIGTLDITTPQTGFAGVFTVNQGVLKISDVNAMGVAITGSGTAVANVQGAQIILNASGTYAEPFLIANSGINSTGSLRVPTGITATLSSALAFNGAAGTLGVDGGGTLNIQGGFTGTAQNLTIAGNGTTSITTAPLLNASLGTTTLINPLNGTKQQVSLGVASTGYTGAITVSNSQFTIGVGGVGSIGAAANALSVSTGGILTVDDTTAAVPNRLGGATTPHTMTLQSGTFNYIANGSSNSTESLGAFTSAIGSNTINITNAGAANASITFASLAANVINGASLLNVTSNTTMGATTSQLFFTTPPTLTPATTGIVQRVLIQDSAGLNFAGYNSDGNAINALGLQAFTNYAVVDGTATVTDLNATNVNLGTTYGVNAAGATNTLRITGDTTALSNPGLNLRTINALKSDGSGIDVTFATSGGTQLAVTSGNLLFTGGGAHTIGNAALVALNSAPVIAFGTTEGALQVNAGTTLAVNAAITGTIQVDKGLGGDLSFNTKQYFGTAGSGLFVQGGTVTLNGGENTLFQGVQGGTANQHIGVNTGATLELNGNSQMIGGLRSGNDAGVVGSGGNINNSGANATFINVSTGTDRVWGGQITGNIFYNKSGSNTQTFYNNNTYGLGTLVNGGALTLTDQGRLSGIGNIEVSNATLNLTNTGTMYLPDRVNDGSTITLRGGAIAMTGRDNIGNATETLGDVNLVRGNNNITVTNGGGTVRSTELTLGTVTATNNAVLNLNGIATANTNNFGSSGRLIIANGNALLTNGIIPWAFSAGTDLVSYLTPTAGNDSGGVASLNATGYVGYDGVALPAVSTPTGNYKVAANTIAVNTGGLNVNALVLASAAAQAVNFTNNSDVLNLTAGTLLKTGNFAETIGSVVDNGQITAGGPGAAAGTYPLYFTTFSTSNTTVNSRLVDNSPTALTRAVFTSYAAGTTVITNGLNSYSGGTTLNGGANFQTILELNVAGANGTTGNSAIPVAATAADSLVVNNSTVRLLANSQIHNSIVPVLNSGGIIALNNFNQTLGGLSFNNEGSTTAPQVTTGTGILTLNGNVTANSSNVGIISTISGAGTGGVAVDLNGATRTFNVSPVTVNGNSTVANLTPTLSISAPISNGGLTKTGNGLLALSGASLFTGGVDLQNGGLAIGASTNVITRDASTGVADPFISGPLGTGTLNIGAGTYLNATAASTLNNDYTLGGNNLTFKGLVNLTLNGATTLNAGATTINVEAPQAILTLNGLINGGAGDSIVKEGLGTLLLGSNNLFGGGVTVNAGTLTLAGINSGSTAPILAGTTATIGTGGLLALQNSGTGSNGLIQYANSVITTGSFSNIHVGNNGANSNNTVELANLTLNGGQTLNVSSANGYSLRLLNVIGDTLDAVAPQINPAAGTSVIIFGFTGDKPINVGQGTLVFPDLVTIGTSTTLNGGTPVTLSGSYPLGVQNAVLSNATLTGAGYSTGSLTANFASLSATPTATVGTQVAGIGYSGSGATAIRLNDGFYGDRAGSTTNQFTNSASVYQGFLNITGAGNYTFRSGADDGQALYIDGNAIISDAFSHGVTDAPAVTVNLSAGNHSIVYKATNAGSTGGFRVLYSGPDTGNQLQSIQSSKFYGNSGAAPTSANNFAGAAVINNDYNLAASTTATIDTFGTQFGAVIGVSNALTLGNDSVLNLVNGTTGSFGTGWFGAGGVTNLGTGVIINTGNTATAGAGTLNLIDAVIGGGTGLTTGPGATAALVKSGQGTLVLGGSANGVTFTSDLAIQGGFVQLNDPGALPAGMTFVSNNMANATLGATQTASPAGTATTTVTVPSTAALQKGMIVSGTGIPAGTYITGITSATQYTVSVPVTYANSTVLTHATSGTLDLNGQTAVAGNVTINGFGASALAAQSNGALWNSRGTSASLAGTLTLATSASVGGNGDLTLTGINSGATATLAKLGTNTLNLNTDNSATLLGPITVGLGILKVGHANALGDTLSGTSLGATVSLTNSTTTTTSSLITVSSTAGLAVGQTLASSTQIPLGAVITSIVSGTQFTINVLPLAASTTATIATAPTGVIDLNGFSIAEPLTLAGAGRTNFSAAGNTLGGLINTAAGASTLTGNITLAGAASVGSNYINAISPGTANGDITFSNPVGGAFLLTKVGSNTLTLQGANTQSGLTISLGNVIVNGAAGQAGTGGNLTVNAGPVSGITPANTLTFDNVGAALSTRAGGAVANRSILLSGGSFNLVGHGVTDVNEALGTGGIQINNAHNLVTLTNSGAITQISGTGTITRNGAGTALIRGTGLGNGAPSPTNTNILLAAPTFTGSAATSGLNTRVVPWIIADDSATGTGTSATAQFATYDATGGFRPLNPGTEMATALNVSSNARISTTFTETTAGSTLFTLPINSLTFEAGGSFTLGSLMNLAIDSGGILAKSSATISSTGTGISRSAINGNNGSTTSREMIVHTYGSGTTLTVETPIGGAVAPSTGGLTKSGDGTLVIGHANVGNSYTGTTRINLGTLQLAATTPNNSIFYKFSTGPAITATASGSTVDALVVNAGATLDLNGHSQNVGNLSSAGALPGAGGIITNTAGAGAVDFVASVNTASSFGGQINGNLNFVKTGTTQLTLTDNNQFTGNATIMGNIVALVDQGRFSGMSAGDTISIRNSVLRWDDSGIQAMGNRIASTVGIQLDGGAFEFISRGLTTGNVTLGDLSLTGGSSIIRINPGNGTSGTAGIFLGGTFARSTGATLSFVSANGVMGDNPFVNALAAPLNSNTNGMLGGWATVLATDGTTGNVNAEFAMYDPLTGIRQVNFYNQENIIATAAATTNVRFFGNQTVLPGGQTVNSVTMNGGTASLLFSGNTDTLTIASGGLLSGLDGNVVRAIGTTALRGRITSSGPEFFIYNGMNTGTANQPTTLTINSDITGNTNPIFSGLGQNNTSAPAITLNNTNTYNGTAYVNGVQVNLGPVAVTGTNFVPATTPNSITGNLIITGGTTGADALPIAISTVRLWSSNQIADGATVTVRGGAQLDLNGFNETINGLVFNTQGGNNGGNGPTVQTGAGLLTIGAGGITASNLEDIRVVPNISGNLSLPATTTIDVGTVLNGGFLSPGGQINQQVGLQINASITGATTINKVTGGALQLGGVSTSITSINVTGGDLVLGAGSNYPNARVTLGGSNVLDMRGASNLRVGNVVGSGVIKNFSVSTAATLTTGADNLPAIFTGSILSDYTSGALNVNKVGSADWNLTADNGSNILGTLSIGGGSVTLDGAAAKVGFITTNLVEGGTLNLTNSTNPLDNRLGGTTSIISIGSTRVFNNVGGVLNLTGNGAANVVENLNTVNNVAGASTWNITGNATNSTVVNAVAVTAFGGANVGSLTLNAGTSTLGTATPGGGFVNVIASSQANANLVGAGGLAGTTTVNIRPDMIGIDSTGTGLVTHDANGFRLLAATEKQTLPTGPSGLGALINGVTANGSADVQVQDATGLQIGQTATTAINGIPANSTITNIVGNTVTFSASATSSGVARMNLNVAAGVNATASLAGSLYQNASVGSLTLAGPGGLLSSGGNLTTTNTPSGLDYGITGTLNTLTITTGAVLVASGNSFLNQGAVTAGTAALQFHTAGNLAMSAVPLGSGGIVKDGVGTLSLNTRSYNTGSTTINEGDVVLGANLGANPLNVVTTATVATTADLVMNSGTLNLNGNSQAVRQITQTTGNTLPNSAGSIINTSGTASALYTAQTANTTFAGTIGGVGGNNLSVEKSGNFNWTLTGEHTYTGATTVRGGSLILQDSGAITGGGAVNVNYATLSLVNSGLSHVAARTGTSAVNLAGATLSLTPRLEGETSASMGALTLTAGQNLVAVQAQTGLGGSVNLNAASLGRTATSGATLNLTTGTGQIGRGTAVSAGQSAQITFTTAPTLTTNLIGGWAIHNGADWLTYLPTPSASGAVGIGVLGDVGSGFADYTTTITAAGNITSAAAANTKATGNFNTNVNGATSLNSFNHTVTNAGNNLTYTLFSDTLTLTTGGFLHTGNVTSAAGQAADYGRVTSSATELFLFNNQSTWTLNNRITGTNKAVFSSGTGGSTIVLTDGASAALLSAVSDGSTTITVPANTVTANGQVVTGPGVPGGTTIVSGGGTTSLVLSNAVPAATNYLNFGTTGQTALAGVTIANTSNLLVGVTAAQAANMFVGQPVFGGVAGVPVGTVIQTISGTTVTISNNTTAAVTAGNVNVGAAGNNFTGGAVVNNGTTLQLVPTRTGEVVIPAATTASLGLVINGGAVNFGASTTNFGLIAPANQLSINGAGTMTFPNYTNGVAVTNTLAAVNFNDNGGTTAGGAQLSLGSPSIANTTHKLILTGATPITAVSDNYATTPTISGGFTNATQFSSLEFSNATPTISVTGASPQGLAITAMITQNAGMTGVLTKSGAGALLLGSSRSNWTTGLTVAANGGTLILGADSTPTTASTVATPTIVSSGPVGASTNGTTAGVLTLANNTAITTDGTARTIANPVTITGNITVGGNTVGNNITLNGIVTATAVRTITVTSPQVTLTIGGEFTGAAGGLNKAGDGTIVLAAANSYTGATTVTGGLLKYGALNAIPIASALTVLDGGTLDINGGGASVTVGTLAGSSNTVGGLITTSATSGTVNFIIGGAANTGFGGAITNNVGSTLNLVKQGTGTQTLGGPNSYTGSTTVTAGTLTHAANDVIPITSDVTLAPGIATGTATMNLNNFNNSIASLTIAGEDTSVSTLSTGTGTATLLGNVTYSTTGGTKNPNGATISGNVVLGSLTVTPIARTFAIDDSTNAAVDVTVSAKISDGVSGADSVLKTGAGTLAFSTATNDYSGPTNINEGVLNVTKLADGGLASSIGDSGTAPANLVIGSAATAAALAYVGTGDSTNREMTFGEIGGTINSSGTGAVNFTSTAAVTLAGTNTARTINLGGTNTAANTFAPQITDNGAGATSLTKQGGGLWSLTSATNSYTGATSVTGGTLEVIGKTGTGATNVTGGSTLAGTGTIDGLATTTHTIDGNLRPGPIVAGTAGAGLGNLSFVGNTTGDVASFGATSITTLGITAPTLNDIANVDLVLADPITNAGIIAGWNTAATSGLHDTLSFSKAGGGLGTVGFNATGTISVGIVAGSTWVPQYGDIFDLIDWGGVTGFSLGGTTHDGAADNGSPFDLPDITASGLAWDTSLFAAHGLVAVVPEPSRMMLLFFGLLGMTFRRRR